MRYIANSEKMPVDHIDMLMAFFGGLAVTELVRFDRKKPRWWVAGGYGVGIASIWSFDRYLWPKMEDKVVKILSP